MRTIQNFIYIWKQYRNTYINETHARFHIYKKTYKNSIYILKIFRLHVSKETIQNLIYLQKLKFICLRKLFKITGIYENYSEFNMSIKTIKNFINLWKIFRILYIYEKYLAFHIFKKQFRITYTYESNQNLIYIWEIIFMSMKTIQN